MKSSGALSEVSSADGIGISRDSLEEKPALETVSAKPNDALDEEAEKERLRRIMEAPVEQTGPDIDFSTWTRRDFAELKKELAEKKDIFESLVQEKVGKEVEEYGMTLADYEMSLTQIKNTIKRINLDFSALSDLYSLLRTLKKKEMREKVDDLIASIYEKVDRYHDEYIEIGVKCLPERYFSDYDPETLARRIFDILYPERKSGQPLKIVTNNTEESACLSCTPPSEKG